MDKKGSLHYNKAKIFADIRIKKKKRVLRSNREVEIMVEKKQKAVITTALIGMNAVIFVVLMMLGKTEDTYFILEHGAMYEPYVIARA